jgi:hypothetical protein
MLYVSRSLKDFVFYKRFLRKSFALFCSFTILGTSGCKSSGSDVIDELLGDGSSDAPLLTAIPSQIVAQTDVFSVDINNIKKGNPGDDVGMSYSCYYDTTVDNQVATLQTCDTIPDSTVTFNTSTGQLLWTPLTALGNFEIKIIGKLKSFEANVVFPVGVRLKFNGITSLTSITGTSVTVSWLPNAQAQGYQIYQLNRLTGLYELLQFVPGGSNSGMNLTGLVPNTGYTLRAHAVDVFGNFDGNTVSRSFTTTTLTRFDMSPLASTVPAGTPLPITVQAYNADGSPQTIGGLTLTPQIQSGTSGGVFSSVTDNDDGTYSFTFTPTTVGTPIEIEVTTNLSFFLNNTVSVTVTPGAPSSITSTLTLASSTVISGTSVLVTANIRDAYNNPLLSSTVTFSALGGTSTGTLSATANVGGGVYTSSFNGIVAGSAKSVRVNVDGNLLTINSPITVLPGPASSANSTLAISSATIPSGSSANITATLRDLNNNLISSGVLVVFNRSGGTSSGSLSGVVNAGNGQYTTSYLGIASGSAQTISLSVDGITLAPMVSITVVPGPVNLANSSLVISSPTVVSGSFVTVTATLRDANSNAIDSGITVAFTRTGGTSTGNFNTVTNQGNGVYNVRYTGVVAGSAQTVSLTVNSAPVAMSVSISVLPGSPDLTNSTLTLSSATVTSGASATATIQLRDANSNPISSGVLVGLTATGGTSTGTIGAINNAGGGVYTATYTGILAGTAQTLNLLTDGTPLGRTATIQVLPAAVNVANSSLVIASPTVISGSSVTLTATLRDLNNNPISASSVVAFTRSGGTSTGTFSAVVNQGNGVYTTTYTGIVAGTAQTLNVTVNAATPLSAVTVSVLPGPASPTTSTLNITAGTVSAGSNVTVTATILDANSNPISSGILVGFTKTGGTSTGTFSAVSNIGGGQYQVNYLGETAGSAQTLGVTVDSVNLGPTTTVIVIPGAPNALLSTLVVSSSTVIAGQSVAVTATIRDSYSNPISTGAIVAFDKSGGTSTGTFSPTVNQGNGVYTTNYTGLVSGTAQTLQANVNLSAFGPTGSIQVLVGTPVSTNSSLSVTSSPVSSGNTATINAVIRDAYNNPITNQYAITFDTIGGTSTGSFGVVNNSGGGNFSTTYQGLIAGTAQTVRVFADGIQISGLTTTVQVVPGSVDAANSVFTTSSGSVQSGSTANLNMNLRDINNNAITSGLTITFNKTSSVSDGNISAVTNQGAGNYSAVYTATTQGTAQTVTLVVNGTPIAALNVSITVTSGVPTKMQISGPSNPVNSIACNGPYNVVLQDAANNTTFSSSAFSMAMSSVPSGWSGSIFSDAACAASITQLNYGIGITTQQFYYKSFTPRSLTFTLTPSLGSIAANSTTLTNAAVLSWTGTGLQFSFNASGVSTVQDDTTGFVNPVDHLIDGNFLYVADYNAHRIIKLDITTNQVVGWIGTIGSLAGISSYDGGGTCAAQAVTNFTSIWCRGGRALQTNPTLLANPRGLAVDGTFLYVTSQTSHRIFRFNKTTGAFQGWFGRINSTAGMSPAGCVAAGSGAVTPTWCTGGTSQTGTGDGHFNTPQQIVFYNNYLYVSDNANHRVQRVHVNGTADGWIGRVGATTPPAGGQLATCSPLPVSGDPTPGWCLGGVAQVSNRYNLSNNPIDVLAPNEGFNNPIGITADSTYLYVGDGNARIVRVNIVSGALGGFIGNSQARVTPSNNATPAANATTRYTTGWSTGGVLAPSASTTGFHPNIRGLNTDGTYIYFVDDYHRMGRVNASDGQGFVQLGRASSTPTGGAVGCSSTPVGGVAPGWCISFNTNSVNNTNGTFFSPYAVTFDPANPTELYVTDYNNFRIQKFNATTGAFVSWIGSAPVSAPQWQLSYSPGVSASRAGIGDYSIGEVGNNSIAVSGFGDFLFSTDHAFHRIKKWNRIDGSLYGYVGLIGTFAPTGPIDCVGYTSGLTPTWCLGGGRTTNGGGIQAYTNPLGITADSTYVYVANTGNHRIDRVRISDGLYMGWIGLVATTPTDGESTCTSTAPASYTPGWCIGGSASNTTSHLSHNSVRAINYNSDGFIYALDSNFQIAKINSTTGAVVNVAGNASAGVGCTISGNVANGWCTSSTGPGGANGYGGINSSNAIASNSTHIFVIDSGIHRINRYDKNTGAPAGFIGFLTGTANLNTTGTGGACAGVTTGYPRATPGWCFGTTVGTNLNHSLGTVDNAFNGALGIWADDSNIYVADSNNHRIVKIDAATGNPLGWRGLIASTTGMSDSTCISAGVGNITPRWCLGGSSTNSRVLGGFDYPTGIWGDTNYVYVIDTRNNRTVTLPK